jgi:hypothetical protein
MRVGFVILFYFISTEILNYLCYFYFLVVLQIRLEHIKLASLLMPLRSHSTLLLSRSR